MACNDDQVVRLPPYTVEQLFTAAELGERIPWSLSDYNVPAIWKIARGRGVRVGVCDSGYDATHVSSGDLKDAIVAAKDFTGSRWGPEDRGSYHGTHVGGTIGAREGNGIGVTGIAPQCEMVFAKVFNDQGSGSDRACADGFVYCVDQGCKVVNFSGGAPGPSQGMKEAIDYGVSKGVVFCVAAGNNGRTVEYPGKYANVCCVSAVNQARQIADFSSRGPEVDIAAPGVGILSCYANGGYSNMSGTSMATPWVSGILALALSADTSMAWGITNALKYLNAAAVDEGDAGRDPLYGFGLIKPDKLIKKPPTPQPPDVTPPEGGSWSWTLGPIVLHIPSVAGGLFSVGSKTKIKEENSCQTE